MGAGWSERLCRQEFARGRRDVQYEWSAMQAEWDDASRAEVVLRRDAIEHPNRL